MITNYDLCEFQKNGYVVIKNVFHPSVLEEIIHIADRLAHQLACSLGLAYGNDYRQAYLRLSKSNRQYAGLVFDSLKKIPHMQRICYCDNLQNVAKKLLGSELVLASPFQQNLRSDMPGEAKFLYPWHTDYDYNQSSSNSLTFWIPLQHTDVANGCLHILKGSHLSKADTKWIGEANGRSAEYFRISNIDDLVRLHQEIRQPVSVGDCLVFSSRLVHKSGSNRSDEIRYAIQSRWFDATAADSINTAYKGGIDEGVSPSLYINPMDSMPCMH